MVVYKFGGATTRTARGLETLVGLVRDAHVAEIESARRRKKRADLTHGVVVVVSAIGHTTRQLQRSAELARDGALAQSLENLDRMLAQHDQLASTLRLLPPSLKRFEEEITRISKATVALIEGISITRELTDRVRDSVLAQGEALAMALISVLLEERGLPLKVIDARDVIITNEDFGSASPIMEEIEQRAKHVITPWLERSNIVLIQGFVGAARDGRTTTMGSESSDLTGTILARALNAEEVVIWKSVPGIFTADPELVPQAKLIKSLSFAEAEELGRRGARILHPQVAHPLKQAKREITLKVSSPKALRSKQTSITGEQSSGRFRPLAVAVEQNLSSVDLRTEPDSSSVKVSSIEARRNRHALSKILHAIASPERTTVYLRKEDRNEFLKLSKDRSPESKDKKALASVSLIFRNGSDNEELRDNFFKSLRAYAPLAIFPVENSLVAIVDQERSLPALRKLHKDFFGA
ncbi:MAG TPA: aspartate kinase [Candidatus Kapabacteria bacterium]|nr:aspartate kinase [Candidatus Kapabacteria bacterium]